MDRHGDGGIKMLKFINCSSLFHVELNGFSVMSAVLDSSMQGQGCISHFIFLQESRFYGSGVLAKV